ncbi:hypothetical protein BDN72DRAFT_848130 [Pluteus cervinus]|uniref:Uncharacterized protein n=1 Tax=Pluteus cervinus TaxID=181527 RepID=A0ACD3ABF1_9AGAR|nr:hypothetical protein BDN72DRAFT_848130 [Pluteus cervinus]
MADDGQAVIIVPAAFSTLCGDHLWDRLDWWMGWCAVYSRVEARSHSLSTTSRADDHSVVAIICGESLSHLRPGGRPRRGHFSGHVEMLATGRPCFLRHSLQQNIPLLCFVDLISLAKRPLGRCIDRAQFSGFPPIVLANIQCNIEGRVRVRRAYTYGRSWLILSSPSSHAFAPPFIPLNLFPLNQREYTSSVTTWFNFLQSLVSHLSIILGSIPWDAAWGHFVQPLPDH